ncbi:unnamed protein product [Brachionus calyciflorus]|uniref:Uncharacterized protein n=1 Tax=Brachionus calyciflorus TaxID=104777 RepID=A0A814KQ97_9BILA|nr:unnamed protein product [Brachionus calyciflorus]
MLSVIFVFNNLILNVLSQNFAISCGHFIQIWNLTDTITYYEHSREILSLDFYENFLIAGGDRYVLYWNYLNSEYLVLDYNDKIVSILILNSTHFLAGYQQSKIILWTITLNFVDQISKAEPPLEEIIKMKSFSNLSLAVIGEKNHVRIMNTEEFKILCSSSQTGLKTLEISPQNLIFLGFNNKIDIYKYNNQKLEKVGSLNESGEIFSLKFLNAIPDILIIGKKYYIS